MTANGTSKHPEIRKTQIIREKNVQMQNRQVN